MNALVSSLISTLEAMFVIGVLGSLAVVAVTLVEDVEVLLNKEENRQAYSE